VNFVKAAKPPRGYRRRDLRVSAAFVASSNGVGVLTSAPFTPAELPVARHSRHILSIVLAFVAAVAAVNAQNTNAPSNTVQNSAGQNSAVQSGGWLDRPLTAWNKPGAAVVPPAQRPSQAPALIKRCSLASPTPSAGVSAVAAAGWIPFLHQDRALAREGIDVIGGLTDASTACAPAGFNLFVFVNGKFAGTLSPVPMTASRDGVAGAVRLVSADSLTTEFARFAPGDLECCPTTRVRVTYRIDRGEQPTVVATGVQVLR
jgi:hypothetical protein